MRAILRQQRLSSVLTAVAVILLGLVLLVWPDLTAELMCRVLGLGVLLAGVVYLLGWLRSRGQEEGRIFFLLPGAVLVGLGLWLLTRPESVITLVQLVSGVVLVFHGLLDLQGAVELIRAKARPWWPELLLALLTLGLGLLIIRNPFSTFSFLVSVIGAALLFDGLSDLWIIARLSRFFKKVERAVEEAIEENSAIPVESRVLEEKEVR